MEAAHAAGQLPGETARLELAADADPLDPVLFTALGLARERLGRRAESIDALETACALAPAAAVPAMMLARLLAHASRLREADAALRRACELNPGNAGLCNDRAAVLMRLHRHAAARELLDTLPPEARSVTGVLCNLATVLVSLGEQEHGEATARRAIALDPASLLARRTLANALPYRSGVSGAEMLAAVQDCAACLPARAEPAFTNSRDPARKLRIGLLSGSLRAHPVGWLTVAGFEALDPTQFDLICLAQATGSDAIARRYRARAAEWHEVDGLDDAALAALARERSVDVLIDLGGYGELGRLVACAQRLAPVQVKWVGMQTHSTGLPEIDWFLSDRWETPPELEQFYSERILRLPNGYVCYSPPAYAPDVWRTAGGGERLRQFRLLQQSGQDHAGGDGRLGGDIAAHPGQHPGAEDIPVLRAGTRGARQRSVRPPGHRRRADRAARRLVPSPVHGGIQPDRPGAGPVPLFRRADHLRGICGWACRP